MSLLEIGQLGNSIPHRTEVICTWAATGHPKYHEGLATGQSVCEGVKFAIGRSAAASVEVLDRAGQ